MDDKLLKRMMCLQILMVADKSTRKKTTVVKGMETHSVTFFPFSHNDIAVYGIEWTDDGNACLITGKSTSDSIPFAMADYELVKETMHHLSVVERDSVKKACM